MSRTDHAQRTASEPRDDVGTHPHQALHAVVVRQVDRVNDRIRVFRLEIPGGTGPINFLPGQWLDTFLPGLPRPGGFTITSPPSAATAARGPGSGPYPYLELAVQASPDNPAARFLWRDPAALVLGTELRVRVGGSFVWPPPAPVKRAVFVAGGVGVNPLVSMASHLGGQPPEDRPAREVRFLYSMKDPGEGQRGAGRMLFLERLAGLFRGGDGGDGEGAGRLRGRMRLFLTGGGGVGDGVVPCPAGDLPFSGRRISRDDLSGAVGEDKESAVVYVCGLPAMTDEFVAWLTSPDGLGMASDRVLCEKWW